MDKVESMETQTERWRKRGVRIALTDDMNGSGDVGHGGEAEPGEMIVRTGACGNEDGIGRVGVVNISFRSETDAAEGALNVLL